MIIIYEYTFIIQEIVCIIEAGISLKVL